VFSTARILSVAALCLVGAAFSLSGAGGCSKTAASNAKVKAVTTTGMIADIVREVGGENVEVTALMVGDAVPHQFKPTEADVRTLADADIIFFNGLNLEGKMSDLFVKLASKRPTVAVSEDIPVKDLREPPEMQNHYDPHVWFDVKLWMTCVRRVERAISERDPGHAEAYRARAAAYLRKLDALDAEVRRQILTVSEKQRVLITAHDAFGYFGRAYAIRVVGLQGISTAEDFGTADIKRLVDVIAENKVKAIFVESSVPERSIRAVQQACKDRGHAVVIGGSLFSDAMGAAGTPEGTYIGMMRHNVKTIVEALK